MSPASLGTGGWGSTGHGGPLRNVHTWDRTCGNSHGPQMRVGMTVCTARGHVTAARGMTRWKVSAGSGRQGSGSGVVHGRGWCWGGAHWEMVSAGGRRGSGDREVVLVWEVGPLGRDSGTQTSAPKNLVTAIRDLVSPNGVGKDSPMDPQMVFRMPGDS